MRAKGRTVERGPMRAMALLVSHELLPVAQDLELQPYSVVFSLPRGNSRPQQSVDDYPCKRKPWEDGSPTVVGLP